MLTFLIASLLICPFIFVNSATAVFPTKIGETLILDLGKDVKEWKRNRDGTEEFIKFCDEAKECNAWIDKETNKIVGDGREHIFENGTLVIDNFQESDVGDYSSHDEMERVHYTADGRIWALARTRITVIAI
ncbi:unnamed protein product [Caenorhabditis angaria]|uniref:Uncharacterized protein n=1 Tax=Caenorhabditis angaria TaxID=860376 RepID=A0A9P1J0I3_9PELO|nr:unnamed protein product [Caenorhabditis angaria]